MSDLIIGAGLSSDQLAAQLQNDFEGLSFPQSVVVENFMPFSLIDTAGGVIYLDGNLKADGVTQGEFSIDSLGHLIGFADNMLTLAKLNAFEQAVGIRLNNAKVEGEAVKAEGKAKKTRSTSTSTTAEAETKTEGGE